MTSDDANTNKNEKGDMPANVLDFKSAKQPHTFNRAESKIKAMRKAFKLSREDANPVPKKRNKKNKNKRNKKKR